MKSQSFYLRNTIVNFDQGDTWFDGEMQIFDREDSSNCLARIRGTDQIIALRDFLNTLDLSGRKLCLVKTGS